MPTPAAKREATKTKQFGSSLIESAYIINAKLAGALGSDSYIVCMQSAALIRSNAEYLRLSNHSLNEMTNIEKKYISVFRVEMEKFRELFILWAKEVKAMKEKDEFSEDEWGLFWIWLRRSQLLLIRMNREGQSPVGATYP